MSSQVYSLLKKTRENKDMSLAFVASKTGISESTLHIIETGEIELLDIPVHTIEAYITRYGEFLGLKELPSYQLPVKAKNHSKLSSFDYLIRLAIIIVLALLIYHVLVLLKQNVMANSTVVHEPSAETNTQTHSIKLQENSEPKTQTNEAQTTSNLTTDQNTTTANEKQMPSADTLNPSTEPTKGPISDEAQTTIQQSNNQIANSDATIANPAVEVTTTSQHDALKTTDHSQNWNKAMQTAIDNSSLSN
ncbi:helix-turn-helix domain-containing protein [Thiotrichales bacterium 19S3-7]|nr:helix-turn-helix domain-containing protein [Thiotrichales bacterium 19S3-7]MCF6801612.1 helix-turn-helix domain-containing protein [Thiotrichales bacterium 19S3-11]